MTGSQHVSGTLVPELVPLMLLRTLVLFRVLTSLLRHQYIKEHRRIHHHQQGALQTQFHIAVQLHLCVVKPMHLNGLIKLLLSLAAYYYVIKQ